MSSPKTVVKLLATLVASSGVALMSACDGSSRAFEEAVEVGQLDIVSLGVTPPEDSLEEIFLNPGQTLQLGVEATNSSGSTISISGSDRRWLSTDPSVFSVNEDGLLTALSDGNAQAYLVLGGLPSRGFRVDVSKSTLTAIDASNIQALNSTMSGSIERCVPTNYRALGTFADSSVRILNTVDWDIDDTENARERNIDASKVELIGENPTTLMLIAAVETEAGAVTGSLPVVIENTLTNLTVNEIPGVVEGTSRNLEAFGTYSDASGTADAKFTNITKGVQWSVVDGDTIVSVSNEPATKGRVTALASGTAQVRAKCGEDETDIPITVNADTTPSNDNQIVFEGSGSTLVINRSQTPTFRLRVSTGTTYDEANDVTTSVTFNIISNPDSNQQAFSIISSGENAGLITTFRDGSAVVTATRNGVTISLTVEVSNS